MHRTRDKKFLSPQPQRSGQTLFNWPLNLGDMFELLSEADMMRNPLTDNISRFHVLESSWQSSKFLSTNMKKEKNNKVNREDVRNRCFIFTIAKQPLRLFYTLKKK